MPVVAALILFGDFLAASRRSLKRLVRAVGLDPDDAGIEHLVDHRDEGVGLERRLALRIEDDRVERGQIDEAEGIAVGARPAHVGPARPGRPRRRGSRPRWAGPGVSRRSTATMRAATSVPPPAGNATMSCKGLVGKSAAAAGAAAQQNSERQNACTRAAVRFPWLLLCRFPGLLRFRRFHGLAGQQFARSRRQ